jgi:hypothetical protein
MYVILAKSLASGVGYRWLHLPGAPPATHFPPGYPAVLAVLWWLLPAFPANVIGFKLANALFMAIAAAFAFRLATTRLAMREIPAAVLTLSATLAVPMLTLSTIIMSESLFLALLMLTLVVAEGVVTELRPRGHDLVLLGVLAAAATLVRTHGIALIGAIALVVSLRKNFRGAAIFGAVAVVLLLPWQLWVGAHSSVVPLPMRGNYESYAAWFAAGLRMEGARLFFLTVARTTTELASMFATVVSPAMPATVRVGALLALVALSTLGARELWRRTPVTAAFLAFYAAIVIVWPFSPTRFIWGIWPLVMLLPALGARHALGWRHGDRVRRVVHPMALASAILLACGYTAYNVRGYRYQWWSSIPRSVSATAGPLLEWIATHTPRDALVATEAETAVYLYTGRPVVPVSTFTVAEYFTSRTPRENAEVIRTIVSHYQPRAVVVSSTSMRNAVRELVLSAPQSLAVVDTFPPGGLVLIPMLR